MHNRVVHGFVNKAYDRTRAAVLITWGSTCAMDESGFFDRFTSWWTGLESGCFGLKQSTHFLSALPI